MTFYPAVDDDVTTDAPVRRRVGHELELQAPDNTIPYVTINRMVNAGVATPLHSGVVHGYRCRCSERANYPIHPTSDNGAEFIIGGPKGVLYGSPAYREAIGIFCDFANGNGDDDPGFGPYRNHDSGGHVHVDVSTDSRVRMRVHALASGGLDHFFAEYMALAAGDKNEVRLYQARIFTRAKSAGHTVSVGDTLRPKDYGSIEFRMWNGSANPTTIEVSAAVSVAVVEACLAERPHVNRSFLDWLSPYMTDSMASEVSDRLDARLGAAAA